MRKFLSFLLIALFATTVAFSQSRSITGSVTDQSGDPVPFATVTVKGTNNAVVADASGNFTIRATTGDILEVTAVGAQTFEVRVGTMDNVTATITRVSTNLTEVTVTTAFGIKKDQRVTPYSAQVIKSDALNIIPQTNLNDALAGKFAGVQVRSQSGTKLNSESFQRVRGGLFLSGDAGLLYVVDGTIVGSGYDINPNNVASLNVLKGANATALFGSRARNGAIVITTKGAGKGKSEITLSQGLTWDVVSILPHLQNQYAGGGSSELITFNWEEGMPEDWKALDGKGYNDYTDDASWGPRMTGQEYIPWYAWVPGTKYSFKTAALTPQPNNIRDFWETGVTSNTNFTFSKGGDGYSVLMDYTRQSITGLIPNSGSDRNILFSKLTADINKFITVGTNININTQKIHGEFNDGYANQSSGNFGQWNHRHLDMDIMRDMKDVITPAGTLATWNWLSNPDGYDPEDPGSFYKANYWYNFYSYMDRIDYTQRRNRLFGDAYIKINITNDLSIKGTVRKDIYNTYYENKNPSLLEKSGGQTGFLSSYSTGQYYQDDMNYEFLASYSHNFLDNDLGVSLNAGGNSEQFLRKENTSNTNNGLIVPDLFAISNSVAQPSIGNERRAFKINSLFATGDVDYKRFISATFALREDWLSTQPTNNAGLFYPSAGLSFIPTALVGNMPNWFSFGKIYGSWGKKPLTLDPYAANPDVFSIGQNQWNGNFLQTTPNSIVDSNFRGVVITSYEAGVELRFLKNRLGLTVNYYKDIAEDQPVSIRVGSTGGYTEARVNSASVERNGLEFIVNGAAISTKNLNWNLTGNLGLLLNNPVTKIIEGQERIQPAGWAGAFGSRYATAYNVLGEDWGQLIGGGFTTGYDSEGNPITEEGAQPLINPTTGLYVTGNPNYNWGGIVPKVTGGFQSLLTYKNITFNASLDYQFGGKFFSLTESWGTFSGLLDYTASTNDRGKNVRDPVSEGGGVHVVGVSSVDGKPVDTYVDGFDYFHQFYSNRIAAPYVHDLSYVKLRELSVGYNLPVTAWSFTNTWLKGMNVSLIARNPWILYRETRNFDPSEIANVYGEDGQLPPVRSVGFNVKFTF